MIKDNTNFVMRKDRGELRLRMATENGFFVLYHGKELMMKTPGVIPMRQLKPEFDRIYDMIMGPGRCC